jgi:putative membrane protein
MQIQLIATTLIILVTVLFALQNAQVVSISLLTWQINASLAVVVATCFGLGIVASMLVAVPRIMREKFSIYRMRKEIETLTSENSTLRNTAKTRSPTLPE